MFRGVHAAAHRRALQRPDRPDERVAGGRRQSRFAQDGGGDQHAQLLGIAADRARSEEHTSELQSLMRISYAVFCLKKKKKTNHSKYSFNTTYTPYQDKMKVFENTY